MAVKPPDDPPPDADLLPGVAILTIEIPDTPPPPLLSEREAVDCLLDALEGGPLEEVSRALDTLASPAECRTFFSAALRPGATAIDIQANFHLAWTVRGFRLREALDDDGLLLAALRVLLPPYRGDGLSLLRGEQFPPREPGGAWRTTAASAGQPSFEKTAAEHECCDSSMGVRR